MYQPFATIKFNIYNNYLKLGFNFQKHEYEIIKDAHFGSKKSALTHCHMLTSFIVGGSMSAAGSLQ